MNKLNNYLYKIHHDEIVNVNEFIFVPVIIGVMSLYKIWKKSALRACKGRKGIVKIKCVFQHRLGLLNQVITKLKIERLKCDNMKIFSRLVRCQRKYDEKTTTYENKREKILSKLKELN